jgi:DNA repair exonuclease SbcCD nuclease subunit
MKIQATRIIMTSDWHFGVRSNNLEWFEIAKDYFDNFFIPWLDQNMKKGDVFYCLGDVFDNRQNLNLMIASYAIDLFEKIAKKIPVYIIVGNHDIYKKNSNEISSVDILKNIQGVTIYKEPEIHEFKNSRCLLMPWRRDKIHEKETLALYSNIDYVFCHSEVSGIRVNSNPHVIHEGGNSSQIYNGYKGMYSGHIHYSQKNKNVTFVGNIFQMNRSDRNNPKGIWTLEPDTMVETFFENKHSPRFLKFNIENLYDKTIEELKNEFNNNFVDIKVDRNNFSDYNMSLLLNLLEGSARSIQMEIFEKDENISILEEENNDYDIMNISLRFIESSNYDKKIKQKLIKSIDSLYQKVNKNENI